MIFSEISYQQSKQPWEFLWYKELDMDALGKMLLFTLVRRCLQPAWHQQVHKLVLKFNYTLLRGMFWEWNCSCTENIARFTLLKCSHLEVEICSEFAACASSLKMDEREWREWHHQHVPPSHHPTVEVKQRDITAIRRKVFRQTETFHLLALLLSRANWMVITLNSVQKLQQITIGSMLLRYYFSEMYTWDFTSIKYFHFTLC